VEAAWTAREDQVSACWCFDGEGLYGLLKDFCDLG
jgi:hypothetical protein